MVSRMNSVSIATNLASDSDERATLRSLVVSMSCASDFIMQSVVLYGVNSKAQQGLT